MSAVATSRRRGVVGSVARASGSGGPHRKASSLGQLGARPAWTRPYGSLGRLEGFAGARRSASMRARRSRVPRPMAVRVLGSMKSPSGSVGVVPAASVRSSSGMEYGLDSKLVVEHCPVKSAHGMHQLRLRYRPVWGGRRPGAGRKSASGRHRVSHHRRRAHDPRTPVHVTFRVCDDVSSLRRTSVFPAVRSALAAASTARFRLVQFSVQSDHVHLIVEADDSIRLARGLQGLAVRVARAINRVLGRRGRVFADRYHARDLGTPREMRNALIYVLNNVRKHIAGARGVDPCSSAPWFSGWRTGSSVPVGPSPVTRACTWIGSVGWRRWGPIDLLAEAPRSPGARRGGGQGRARWRSSEGLLDLPNGRGSVRSTS